MSGFCIYGMTKAIAKTRAMKNVSTVKNGIQLTVDEHNALVEIEAEKILQTAKARQISPAFDAPQFALEWKEIAVRSGAVRMKLMAKGALQDAKGAPKINKRTGKPSIGWVSYKIPKAAA